MDTLGKCTYKSPHYQGILIFLVSLYHKVCTIFGTITKCVDYAGVLIFKCPDYQVYCIILLFVLINGQSISNPYFKRVCMCTREDYNDN